MKEFETKITRASRELTAREKIALKDTTNAIALDEATKNGEVRITPAMWAVLSVHNEAAEDKDYEKYIIVDEQGLKYVTGSKSFARAFFDIADEIGDEAFQISVYRKESRNYKGKEFITCSIL